MYNPHCEPLASFTYVYVTIEQVCVITKHDFKLHYGRYIISDIIVWIAYPDPNYMQWWY